MNTRIYCTACLLLPLVGALAQPAATEEGPETRLFDTGNPLPSAGMPTALPATTGWKLVPEETTTHPFSGSAVILNDKLAITFTEHSRGPTVYSRSTGKPLASVALSPTSALEGPLMTGWQILENSASGVKIECVYLGNRPLRIRLTTGESIVELQSPKLKRNLEVRSDSRFTVVSDYFGDDLVYPDGSYVGALPAENFCLNLLGDGDAILMSVWQSNQQEGWLSKYDAAFGSSHTAQLITALQDKNVWLAFLEGPGIWHARSGLEPDQWRAPFPAKWRTSFLRKGIQSDSWDAEEGPSAEQKAGPHSGPALTYPIDRTAATPLTATCPTDVMRNTLGVGPCQYILACEGMAAQGDPTPNSVMTWVEKQFEQKKQRKAADDIKERLEHMVRHVGEARGRIERYAAFERDARTVSGKGSSALRFAAILDDLARFAAEGLSSNATQVKAQQLAGKVVELLGQSNGFAASREIGEQLRAIGAAQDRALARCRMAVRRLRLAARANENAEVQRLCEDVLK